MGRKRMQGLSVRTFNEGDEASIVELFNRVYQKYGCFVPRTVEYWKWCCLERPDVDKKGIILLFDNKETLCGYLVAGSTGNIWEFCVSDDNQEASEVLLGEATKYLTNIGASDIIINVPKTPGILSALRENGFDEAAGSGLFATTLNPAALIQALIEPTESVIAKEFNGTLTVSLSDTPYGVKEHFSVKIRNDSVTVTTDPQEHSSITIETQFMDMISILIGNSNPTRIFLRGQISVKPFWKFPVVLKLLSTIRIRDPWFFPMSDSI